MGVGVWCVLHIAGEITVVLDHGRIRPDEACFCAVPACLGGRGGGGGGAFFSVGRGCTAWPADRPRELRG